MLAGGEQALPVMMAYNTGGFNELNHTIAIGRLRTFD